MQLENLILGNAAGLASTYEEARALVRSAVTRVTFGPVTLLPRPGNSGQTYAFNQQQQASANSRGLPSLGIEDQTPLLRTLGELCRENNKLLAASIAGFDVDDWPQLIISCHQAGVRHVELNLGCPNVWGVGGRKPIPSYDPELAEAILRAVKPAKKRLGDLTVGVKISPVEDQRILSDLADVITESGTVSEVVACNTIPDQDLLLEDGSHALTFSIGDDPTVRHVGGLAGAPLHDISVRIVGLLRVWLPASIRILGCGGVFTGKHAKGYLDAGAAGVECGTALAEYGPGLFSEIWAQLAVLMLE